MHFKRDDCRLMRREHPDFHFMHSSILSYICPEERIILRLYLARRKKGLFFLASRALLLQVENSKNALIE